MNLKNAKLGETYFFPIDKYGFICKLTESVPGRTRKATVIAIKTNGSFYPIIIGWKNENEAGPKGDFYNRQICSLEYEYIPDEKDYLFGKKLASFYEIPDLPIKSDGCNCDKCNDYCQFAEPNQADGSFKCYKCRGGR